MRVNVSSPFRDFKHEVSLVRPLSLSQLCRRPRLTLWFKYTRLFPNISSSGSSLPHVHTHPCKHTHAHAHAGSVRWQSSWQEEEKGDEEGRDVGEKQSRVPPRRTSTPCCCCASTCRPRSQFGSHEVDVRLGQGEQRQAALELRHVLNQRGLWKRRISRSEWRSHWQSSSRYTALSIAWR